MKARYILLCLLLTGCANKDIEVLNQRTEPVIETTKEKIIERSKSSYLVNSNNLLSETYKPTDLTIPNVEFPFEVYLDTDLQKQFLSKEAASSLESMFKTAKMENINLLAISGYRSYERQVEIYNYNLNTYGKQITEKTVALPGSSEHQTGLAIDISGETTGYKLVEDFINTPEGKWVNDNCYKFGYIIRYPKGKENITGYSYEPWHIRYVGIEDAKYIYDHDLTLEEYWEL